MASEPTTPIGDYPVPDDLEAYVLTEEFDKECDRDAHLRVQEEASDASDSEFPDTTGSPASTSTSSVGASPHEVDPLEARFYYYGVGFKLRPNGRGIVRGGPKLVYRTSKDVWVPPTEEDHGRPREMRLHDIPEDHLLSQDPALWDRIRDQVVEVFKREDIKFSTVELVCFTWKVKKEDCDEAEEDEAAEEKDDGEDGDAKTDEPENLEDLFDSMPVIKPVEKETRYTTPPTIWVGVLVNTLTAEKAHDLSAEILGITGRHGVTGVEVGFRESKAQVLSGPALFAPVDDDDFRKDMIDNFSAALPLSVAGQKTPMQGTLTCYFRVGNELYAISARHNFFVQGKEDAEFNFNESAPKKEVIVLGSDAFNDYLIKIRGKVGSLNDVIGYLATREESLMKKVDADPGDTESADKLENTRGELAGMRNRISIIKKFYVEVVQGWSKIEDRVIGHVVWAPKVEVNVPYGFTKDFCVIHLNKDKFKGGFLGNTLSLGPEIPVRDFVKLMYDRDDVPSEFRCPQRGLAEVKGILTAEQINEPNRKDGEGELIRRVIKRGMTSKTTVGGMTKLRTHVRHYLSLGPRDSIEVTILPHPDLPGPFSRGGDSGALITDPFFRFVALLTSGSGMGNADLSDITYGTPFDWIWNLVKDEYPGAVLYFDDLTDFFKD